MKSAPKDVQVIRSHFTVIDKLVSKPFLKPLGRDSRYVSWKIHLWNIYFKLILFLEYIFNFIAHYLWLLLF